MHTSDVNPNIGPARARRAALFAKLGEGVAIIPTAPERIRNRDSDYLYRFDSSFYYLSAFPEPEAVLVLVGGSTPKSILFCREKNEEREIWDGFRYGIDAARDTFGMDETHPISTLDTELPKLLANRKTLFYAPGAERAWDQRVMDWLNVVRAQTRTGITAPTEISDIRALLDEMRLHKDAHELALMQKAADISSDAHIRAMRATRAGALEYDIEAELLHEFRRRGSQFPAYWPIVASGPNACVLHYRDNNRTMGANDLLLIDAGCELDGYAADITRTFPVNGVFSGPQREVYELVLASQAAAIAEVRPGNTWIAPHDAATRVLAQGFIDLKLLTGTLDGVLESGDFRRFYMHRTGHWLGLDVHDVGEYKLDSQWRPLVPGMVLTVEPGTYIRPADNVPQAFWNIGVRIEDDVVVTAAGCDVMSARAPKSVSEIEALMRDRARD